MKDWFLRSHFGEDGAFKSSHFEKGNLLGLKKV